MIYIVTYKGVFGFIKPWTAVRDSETFSQQFLTPSIIEGIEKKLFPILLDKKGIYKIRRHKLSYESMSIQQEVTQTRGWNHGKNGYYRDRSILNRDILLRPTLLLAFDSKEDAVVASKQHICLCRNEDILLPEVCVKEMTEEQFSQFPGFELRFGKSENSFLVGYNRFNDNDPMYGWIEYAGQSLLG